MDATGGVLDGRESRLSPYSKSILQRFDAAVVEPKDVALAGGMKAFRPQLVATLSQYPDISKAPANVRAALYAITNLGNNAYGKQNGVVTDQVLTPVGNGDWKCNIFVAKAYGLGGGIGYNIGDSKSRNGYPVNTASVGPFTHRHPPMANDLHNRQHSLPNFPVASKPKFGDIAAFGGQPGLGHATIYLGDNLLLYAGANDVKLGTPSYIREEDGYTKPITYRTYVPGDK